MKVGFAYSQATDEDTARVSIPSYQENIYIYKGSSRNRSKVQMEFDIIIVIGG